MLGNCIYGHAKWRQMYEFVFVSHRNRFSSCFVHSCVWFVERITIINIKIIYERSFVMLTAVRKCVTKTQHTKKTKQKNVFLLAATLKFRLDEFSLFHFGQFCECERCVSDARVKTHTNFDLRAQQMFRVDSLQSTESDQTFSSFLNEKLVLKLQFIFERRRMISFWNSRELFASIVCCFRMKIINFMALIVLRFCYHFNSFRKNTSDSTERLNRANQSSSFNCSFDFLPNDDTNRLTRCRCPPFNLTF